MTGETMTTKPITTQAALNAPCLSATEHVLRTLTKRPPTGLTALQRTCLVFIIDRGKELIKEQRDVIVRLESSGGVWRLAVKPPTRSELKIKAGKTDAERKASEARYHEIFADLERLGYLVRSRYGGGVLYSVADPR